MDKMSGVNKKIVFSIIIIYIFDIKIYPDYLYPKINFTFKPQNPPIGFWYKWLRKVVKK
jgi:hypothetical protein